MVKVGVLCFCCCPVHCACIVTVIGWYCYRDLIHSNGISISISWVPALSVRQRVADPARGTWQSSEAGILQHRSDIVCSPGLLCCGRCLSHFAAVSSTSALGPAVWNGPFPTQAQTGHHITPMVEWTSSVWHTTHPWRHSSASHRSRLSSNKSHRYPAVLRCSIGSHCHSAASFLLPGLHMAGTGFPWYSSSCFLILWPCCWLFSCILGKFSVFIYHILADRAVKLQ